MSSEFMRNVFFNRNFSHIESNSIFKFHYSFHNRIIMRANEQIRNINIFFITKILEDAQR